MPSRGSTLKNRVWGFESIPSGLTCSGPGSSWENAAGCVQYSYKNASGRTEFLQTDPLRFGGLDENLYRYVGNDPLSLYDPLGLAWYNDAGTWLDNSLGNLTGTDPAAWQQSAAATLDGMINTEVFALDPCNQYNQQASWGLGLTGSTLIASAVGFRAIGINPPIGPMPPPPPPTLMPPPPPAAPLPPNVIPGPWPGSG